MRRIDRFDNYIKFKGLNDNKVTAQLGLSVGLIGKSRGAGRDLSDNVIEKILNFYSDLNKVWLLTGEGEMIVNSQLQNKVESNDTIVLPMSVWKVIQAQVESLSSRDRQIDELIQLLRTQIDENRKNDVRAGNVSCADAG